MSNSLVIITGPSGVGKSTVGEALSRAGERIVDMDSVLQAWKGDHATKEQVAEYMRKLGYNPDNQIWSEYVSAMTHISISRLSSSSGFYISCLPDSQARIVVAKMAYTILGKLPHILEINYSDPERQEIVAKERDLDPDHSWKNNRGVYESIKKGEFPYFQNVLQIEDTDYSEGTIPSELRKYFHKKSPTRRLFDFCSSLSGALPVPSPSHHSRYG